jgi:MerR family glutamine synthetase transcriptional repressor
MAIRSASHKSIAEVRRDTGLSERQIRYYETLGLVTPGRSRGRQRLYTPSDVERLRQIKEWMDAGVALKTIREWLSRDPGAGEPEDSDAASYFRGQSWVRSGHADPALYEFTERPDLGRRLKPDDDNSRE